MHQLLRLAPMDCGEAEEVPLAKCLGFVSITLSSKWITSGPSIRICKNQIYLSLDLTGPLPDRGHRLRLVRLASRHAGKKVETSIVLLKDNDRRGGANRRGNYITLGWPECRLPLYSHRLPPRQHRTDLFSTLPSCSFVFNLV